MTHLSISRAWDETRRIFARDGKLMVSVAAALILLPQVIAGVVTGQASGQSGDGVQWNVLLFVAAIIGLVAQLAIAWLAIGAKVSVGESIRHGLGRTPAMIGAILLLLLALIIASFLIALILMAAGVISAQTPPPNRDVVILVLLIAIPALFLSIRLMPTVAVATAEKVGPIGILKRSWALTSGHFWKLLGFVAGIVVAALIVAMAVGAVSGLLVRGLFGEAEPFSMAALIMALVMGLLQMAFVLLYVVMIARIYVQLTGGEAAETSVPPSGS